MNGVGTPDRNEATRSVAALFGDIAHVVRELAPTSWAQTVQMVIAHHTPLIEADRLSPAHRTLQSEAHALLHVMVGSCDDVSIATKDEVAAAAEALIVRWNGSVLWPELHIEPLTPQSPVIDLRAPTRPATPEFKPHEGPPPRLRNLRRLAERRR